MKAIVVTSHGGPEVLAWMEVPDPQPAATQVLIQVAAASVNYADIKARAGGYHLARKPPFIPGIDVAGTVLQTGREVTNFRPGDRVCAFPVTGSYAEKTVAEGNLTFAVPPSVTLGQAAALPVAAGAAYQMLVRAAGIGKGDSVLVHSAAGGVGTMALQMALHLGARIVIGSTGSPWKAERLVELGAHLVVDNRAAADVARILEATGGKGVDIILNPLGGASLSRDLECLAPHGRLVLFGGKGNGLHLSPASIYPRNQSILGCSFGHLRKTRPDSAAKSMRGVLDLFQEKKIKTVIGARFPLSKAPDAHRYIESRQNIGKVLLDIDRKISSDTP